MKYRVLLMSCLCVTYSTMLICSDGSDHENPAKYDQASTAQLQTRVDDINDPLYWQRLLSEAALKDDLELVNCCLEHGASAVTDDQPVKYAQSVPVLQLLLNAKANLLYKEQSIGGLLHCAATLCRSPDFMTFLCNAGLDVNAKNENDACPLCSLFSAGWLNETGEILQNALIFSWYGAHDHKKYNDKISSDHAAQSNVPAATFKSLVANLPEVKAQHQKEYTAILAKHITAMPAGMVMTYIDHLGENVPGQRLRVFLCR